MTNDEQGARLDEVLESYLATCTSSDAPSLAEWAARYPQFAEELFEFAATRGLIDALPERVSEAEERAVESRAGSILRDVWRGERGQTSEQRAASARRGALVSLVGEAGRAGMSSADLANRANLSPTLVDQLDDHQIEFSTIPKEVIEDLSRALDRRFGVVATYLRSKPSLRAAARIGQRHDSRVAADESFLEAVRRAPDLSVERRRRLIDLARHQR
jgi:hypothetical protein